ncbi:glutathione S-transferase family protein [Pseudohoeflea suaedae]|uniref:Glutathione S-transferase family protein n=1 Tax=Pseudohoeflea suaedae TaxID=877384 RepID=A0A4R5PJC2_9HYPH|nr:glutathione S-transferase family protein [Pseudohoeflea suaedae]TDH35750.1 glutathione S-transferase family protein [Pseudohoeflea suaedae]
MAILYHSPNSRSDAVAALVRLLKADIEIREVEIRRTDGTGRPDPVNPHPEKKVPYLVDGDEALRERGAIITYLTDKYPDAELGPLPGEPGRGAYLSWLYYYQGVMEPVIIMHMAGIEHPYMTSGLRDFGTMMNTLTDALKDRPFLMGERFSAADILCSSPFFWLSSLVPEDGPVPGWGARCAERMKP